MGQYGRPPLATAGLAYLFCFLIALRQDIEAAKIVCKMAHFVSSLA